MRVLLDANIFISYLLYPEHDSPSALLIRAAIRGEFMLLLPDDLLREFARKVRQKPYLAKRIQPDNIYTLESILGEIAETIPHISEPIPTVTRDPKDDYLIAYALVGEADYLVTGDRDLLVIEQFDTVKIVTPRDFLTIFGKD